MAGELTGKSKKPKGVLRGVALVDAAMATRKGLKGMSAKQLGKTTLGDQPLTPALKRWLECDKDLFTLGEPQSFRELVESEYGDEWVWAFEKLHKLLTAPCVLFDGWGADSRRFLYLGKPDSHGEYPVFTLDNDDTPYLCINGPADVWLAQQVEFLEEEHVYGHVPEAYEAARKEHAKLNFGGYVAFLDDALHKKLDPY